MMKFFTAILLSFFLVGNSNYAKPVPIIMELDHLADEALQLTRNSRLEEAKSTLETFGSRFAEEGVKGTSLTMDELRILSLTHHEALKAVTSINMDLEERIRIVTAFRLAADAVHSTHQPMWREMKDTVMGSLREMKNHALEGSSNDFNSSVNRFLASFDVIQPSLLIDYPPGKVQKIESKIKFLDRYRNQVSEKEWMAQLEELEVELKALFDGTPGKDEADPSLWWVIAMTGSTIILTLSYVGWRKYKGLKQDKKKRHKDLNH